MLLKYAFFILISISFIACLNTDQSTKSQKVTQSSPDSVTESTILIKEPINDTAFVNLRSLSTDFVYDMRYASENNFLNEKVYYCDNCLLRYNVAKALISANAELINQNLRIKLFDCFRLVSVQRKMWKIMPDSRYVANPNKSGSVHNRGAAVDLTIVDLNGKELDMGTDFDHFGKEAHHDFKELDQKIISNRALLKRIMEDAGFSGIRTEWWHFQYGAKSDFPISTTALCEN